MVKSGRKDAVLATEHVRSQKRQFSPWDFAGAIVFSRLLPRVLHPHYNRTFEKKGKHPRSQPVERLSS